MERVRHCIFLGSKITADCYYSHEIKRCLLLRTKAMTNLDSILKSRDITLPKNIHLVKAMLFFSSHVWMWNLDHRETWALKNWCFWTVVLEKKSWVSLGLQDDPPVNPKVLRPEYSLEGLMLKLQLWPPDVKNWLIGKNLDSLKDWRREKGVTADEMVGWHHLFKGHEFG